MSIKQHKDQLGREVVITSSPKRIVSLVPSQTELLHYLGLKDEVIGITKFCIHPEEWFKSKRRVGGTKKVNHSAIEELKPDLVIANKEENTLQDIQRLEENFPVWISDIHSYNDALNMIEYLGQVTNREAKAIELTKSLKNAFSKINLPKSRKKILYVIWNDPIMIAGQDTFINEMLLKAGFQNAIEDKDSRYPEITPEDIQELNPDFVFLSSEPFPFSAKHIKSYQYWTKKDNIMLVDGELFSWYGSRMLLAPTYFQELIERTK